MHFREVPLTPCKDVVECLEKRVLIPWPSGSLDDPKFSVWRIVLKIIRNPIAKAAASPFAFLGDIPAPEMEKLMLTHIEVTDGVLGAPASQRAMKVKDAILKSGQV